MNQLERAPDLRTYLDVLWRRKWLIAIVVLTVPIVAYTLAGRGTKVYESSSEVLLTRAAQGAAEINDPTFWNPERAAQTQVRLARVPEVAQMTLDAARIEGRGPGSFLSSSSVEAEKDSDLMIFRVRDTDPPTAERLATAYAEQYIAFRNDLETGELKKARFGVETQIREREAADDTDSPLYAALVQKQQQLLTAETLATSTAKLVRPADGAGQVEPRPIRAGMLGVVVAVVLALAFAFVIDAFDSRIRNPEEIGEALGLPLLAQIPPTTANRRGRREVAMLSTPDGHEAETYRMLRTNIDFANLDIGASAIMITSAVEQEGKSTTIANLAVAYARAGRRVVVVDLDLRRPTLDDFFGAPPRPGVTEVVLGRVQLEDAICRVPLDRIALAADGKGRHPRVTGAPSAVRVQPSGRATSAGTLEVLVAGAIPPNPGEFVTSKSLDTLLEQLRARADVLLVDAPPMLLVGDALALSAKVDAVVLAARATTFRRPMARELARLLQASPARTLGLVVTSAPGTTSGRYYYSLPHREREPVA